jgi:hypothetical protein
VVLLASTLLVPARSNALLADVPDPSKRHKLQDARLKLQRSEPPEYVLGDTERPEPESPGGIAREWSYPGAAWGASWSTTERPRLAAGRALL